MKIGRFIYKMRLGLLAALGFGSLVSCNPPKMYGPPVMYGPAPDMYGPPTELLPESDPGDQPVEDEGNYVDDSK